MTRTGNGEEEVGRCRGTENRRVRGKKFEKREASATQSESVKNYDGREIKKKTTPSRRCSEVRR